jgi:GTP-binding nuclear protein Ran
MFDQTMKFTYDSIAKWHRKVERVCWEIPFVLVGNKADAPAESKMKPQDIFYHRKISMQYYHMSVKTNHMIQRPFLYLIRELLSDDSVRLVNVPPFLEPQNVNLPK